MTMKEEKKNQFKSTFFRFCVVHFIFHVFYSIGVHKGGQKNMNTDKIYAESIVNEYAPKETSKVVALKKLDRKAKEPANIFAFTFGILSSLLLGTGMSLSMKVIGDGSTLHFIIGIVVGILGIIGVSVNYFIYKKLLERGKKKYGSDIIRLAKEIADKE